MALSWNEIKKRALDFSKEYAAATRENAETHSFYNDFFNVFGISRRRIASFEEPVKKLGDKRGRIDLFWKGTLLVEQKSAGRDLVRAKQQALDYFPNLKEYELPRYIIVSDFQNFELYDLEENTEVKFPLSDLYKNVNHFGFIAGYTTHKFEDQEPVNIEAAELIGGLHDSLVDNGYTGIELEQFLIRVLFCLFADNTGIFEKNIFKFYIEEKTSEDGINLGNVLEQLFQVLNQPENKRQKNIDEELAAFRYINGDLFAGFLPIVSFNSTMRRQLIKCCHFDWSKISPAIFGAMFQSATDQNKRRNLGAHYTSEQNIMKIIKPLFLDELKAEFENIKKNKKQLAEFHDKISNLKFLDPACGCGNFLIIAYRELRELEINLLKSLHKDIIGKLKGGISEFNVRNFVKLNINQFYGIEIEELPAKIAEVAMWLVDHQMNMKLSEEFGQYFARIPLSSHANICHANALRMNWEDLIKKTELSYILGNPPFVGNSYQNEEQKKDIEIIFGSLPSSKMLDYVACWYIVAARYIQSTKIKVGFVSTNSISQGEQVGILWNEMFSNYGIKIHFAHRTFAWSNEAKGKAAVFCVIIGFANFDTDKKFIYEYQTPKSESYEIIVKNINSYLVECPDIVLNSLSQPLSEAPKMQSGSAARDGGFLILSDSEKEKIISSYPNSQKLFKPFISGDDFINNKTRWCIWLKGISPTEFINIKEFQERFRLVKEFREKSPRVGTKKMANLPYLFAEERQPNNDFLLIPKVSSESRIYIPIAYLSKNHIVSDKTFVVPNAKVYLFGLLTSSMHMTWMRYTAGRLKGDYSYSNTITYNNFPFPKNPTPKQIAKIEEKAQNVLDARALYPQSSLADLYHPLTMPAELVKAHNDLDKAVDVAYGKASFKNERERIEFLFNLYQEYTEPLFKKEAKKRVKHS